MSTPAPTPRATASDRPDVPAESGSSTSDSAATHGLSVPALGRVRSLLPALGFMTVAVVIWQLAVALFDVADYVLPAPIQIVAALIDNASVLVPHTVTTLTESVIGLAVGTATGVALAIGMGMSRPLMQMFSPLLVTSQTVPIIVLAPLLVLWFGYGLASKVAVVALMAFFPVAISMTGGLLGVDPHRIDLMDAMGSTRWQTMRFVRIPNAIPSAVDGLRISAAYAVGGAVVGEWTGAEQGLGVFIDRSRASYRIDQVFAGVVVVTLLSLVLFIAVGGLGRLLAPWHYGRHQGGRTRSAASAPTGAGSV